MKSIGSCLGIYQPTLIGVSARRIASLSSEEFRARLLATSWSAVTLEQLDAIEGDERLSVIADEILSSMLGGVLNGEAES